MHSKGRCQAPMLNTHQAVQAEMRVNIRGRHLFEYNDCNMWLA